MPSLDCGGIFLCRLSIAVSVGNRNTPQNARREFRSRASCVDNLAATSCLNSSCRASLRSLGREARCTPMENLLRDIGTKHAKLRHGRLLSDGRSTPPSSHIDAVGGVHPITEG